MAVDDTDIGQVFFSFNGDIRIFHFKFHFFHLADDVAGIEWHHDVDFDLSFLLTL